MSDVPEGQGWWEASDGRWYPPTAAPGEVAAGLTAPPPQPPPWNQAPPVAPPGYGYGYQPVPVRRNSGLAIGALVAGLVGSIGGLITCGLLTPGAIVAVILGHISLSRMKQDPTLEGRGMALTGTILGWAMIGLSILGVVLVLATGAADSTGS